MAEVVVNVLVEQLISAAADWLQEEISLIKGVKTKLDNMKSKMLMIQTVLESAETQSVKNKFVKIWLEELQDVSYDMVDVLDEWNTKVQRVEENSSKEILVSSSSSSSPTTSKSACLSFKQLNCFSSIKQVPWRRDIASRINDIEARVNLLFTQMNTWDLVSKSVENVGLGMGAITTNCNHIDRTTTSFVDESIVFGRDADRDFLLGKVLSSVDAGHNSMQLISIVGAGGLGKTTLAQLVYNHEKVKKRFGEKRIWVCVSDPFDEVKVAQGILEGLKVDHTKMKSLQTLHQSIEASLSKYKFLLVLDDVWDEDFGKWERLSICLKRGNPESIVLVTTRNEIVARTMGTMPSNILKPRQISDSDCWLLMSQRAFQGRTDKNNNEFEDIGKQIAKKCQDLPLAAKTLGGLLVSKDLAQEWKEVLNSEMWELDKVEIELFPRIFLSYKELSPVLKRCFLILALFPKGLNLLVQEVFRIWMGNGFLNPLSEEEMEKTGEKYLNFLVSRAFLVEGKRAGFSLISMHDIMHDFAIHISGGELLSIMVHDTTVNSSRRRVRHFKIVGNINPSLICFDVGKFRTCDISYVPPNVASDFVERLKRVRMLYLNMCKLQQVPESIGNLIHLRVLLLSDNPLVKLPETIGNLYNLQQLYLERLTKLSSLPQSMGKLSNLISIIPSKMALEKAPESVGKLINLQSLGKIRVEAGKSNLRFLIDLNQLRRLEIEFISDYGDDVDAKKAAIGRKRHVKEYSLTFNEFKVTDDVVEALKPHPNVQTLRIYHQFPD